MTTTTIDTSVYRTLEDEANVGAEYCASLHDMLPRCDIVLLSCPLTAETRGMVGRREFSVMKNTAMLVNVARGRLLSLAHLTVRQMSLCHHGSDWLTYFFL